MPRLGNTNPGVRATMSSQTIIGKPVRVLEESHYCGFIWEAAVPHRGSTRKAGSAMRDAGDTEKPLVAAAFDGLSGWSAARPIA